MVDSQTAFWIGSEIDMHGDEFQKMVRRAYHAIFEQCQKFRNALAETGTKRLFHTTVKTNKRQIIHTEKEFCDILTN